MVFNVSNFVKTPSAGDNVIYIYDPNDRVVMSIDPYVSTFYNKVKYVYILSEGRMDVNNVLEFATESDANQAIYKLNESKKTFMNGTQNSCGSIYTREQADDTFLSLSGGTVTGNITAATFYGDGSNLTGLVTAFFDLTSTAHTHLKSDISNFNENDYVHTFGDEILFGNKTFANNIDIIGDLFVSGTTVYTLDLNIADRYITLNSGETGSGVTLLQSGIIIDRGAYSDYWLIFDESAGYFMTGFEGTLLPVANRQLNPNTNSIAYWNSAQTLMSDNLFTFISNTLNVPIISATTFYGDGSQLTGVITDHNTLTNLQGGTGGTEYYHLTQNEYTYLGKIGEPEDTTYTDGLFIDFTGSTRTGIAIDRFNKVLKALSPSPAPNLSDWDGTKAGTTPVSGKLSFGSSNVIPGYTNSPTVNINDTWAIATKKIGIVTKIGNVTGKVNPQVSGYTGIPYNNYSFGDGDLGRLELYLNGSIYDILYLNTTTGATASTYLSASQIYYSKFADNTTLDIFKHRTATYTILGASLIDGYNYIRISHIDTSFTRTVTIIELIVDSDTTATVYSSDTLTGLTMTGSKFLSGVEYYTGGNATYSCVVSNAYRNTYSNNSITFNISSNLQSITSMSIPTAITHTDTIYISKTANITTSGIRILNSLISVSCIVPRALVAYNSTSTVRTITGILLDNIVDSSNSLTEGFDDENYRLATNNFDTYGAILSNTWSSNTSLISNSGLQIYNSTLIYPVTDFSSIVYGPAGNPNYTVCTGNRTYYRYFRQVSPTTSLFYINIAGSGGVFVSQGTALTNQNVHVSIKLPGSVSMETGWLDCTANKPVGDPFNDGDGCKGTSSVFSYGSNINLNIGAKSTANSNGYVIVKIEVGDSFTGNFNSITFGWSNV